MYYEKNRQAAYVPCTIISYDERYMMVKTPGLIFATLKNIRATALNREMIGFSIERTLGPVTPGHIRRYAQATRDPNPAYCGVDPIAPPFFLSCLIWDHMKEIYVHPDLHVNFFRLMHAEQRVSWHSPIHAGDILTARIMIKDIEDTRAGQLLKISGSVITQDGSIAAEATAGLMIKNPSSAKKTEAHPAAERHLREMARLEIRTEIGQNLDYARASGDRSFIHISNRLARLAGLPGAVMHGICLLSMACSAYTGRFLDGDSTSLTGAYTRFSYPALPGETLSMICFEGPPGETPFTLVNRSGRTVLSRGIITYKRSGA